MIRLLALLSVLSFSFPQDKKPVDAHTSPEPRKCRKCSVAYEKAMAYLQKKMGSATFPAKMVIAWLMLADGRYEGDLKQLVNAARQALAERGSSQHAQNWYPALAGMFLAEAQKYQPAKENLAAMQSYVDEFVKVQERTGGWFKWHEGAYNERKDYPVKDLGILNAIIYGFLWSARTHGCKVPDTTIAKADALFENEILTSDGISYGFGQKGGDPTGARGGFCIRMLDHAGKRDHRIWKTYEQLLVRQIPNMDKGHHVGAFHCLGMVLGCQTQGPEAYSALTKEWLDKLIAKQDAEGAVYIGDDGDAGGEIGLLKSNYGSTAAFALLILLQDQKVLRPPVKKKK